MYVSYSFKACEHLLLEATCVCVLYFSYTLFEKSMQGAIIYHNEKPTMVIAVKPVKRMKKLVGDERNVQLVLTHSYSISVEHYIRGVYIHHHLLPIIPYWGLPVISFYCLLTTVKKASTRKN